MPLREDEVAEVVAIVKAEIAAAGKKKPKASVKAPKKDVAKPSNSTRRY